MEIDKFHLILGFEYLHLYEILGIQSNVWCTEAGVRFCDKEKSLSGYLLMPKPINDLLVATDFYTSTVHHGTPSSVHACSMYIVGILL